MAQQLKPFITQWKGRYADYGWFPIENQSQIVKINVEGLPKAIVKLQGEITEEIEQKKLGSETYLGTARYIMARGKLLSVEFLNEEWLKKLQDLANLKFDPWSNGAKGKPISLTMRNKSEIQKKAKGILAILLEMKQFSRITDAMREAVKKVDSNAIIVKEFQGHVERIIHKWLIENNEDYELNLEGIETLGPLPPSREEVEDIFISSSNKKEFFEKVQSKWGKYLDELTIWYMHPAGGGESFGKSITLSEMLKNWSEEDFQRHRRTAPIKRIN